ncbi:hypothetical protein ACHAXM_000974 [Skeletonema potamos]
MNPSSTSADYSVNYSSSSTRRDENILLPGQQPTSQDEDEGVVITPTPTNIVIKTRLVKQKHNPFAASNDQSNDSTSSSYFPPSLSNISATSESQDTKVFINVCTHSIISLPSQRKTLDENGEPIEGWRLPMSMGDLRPFYDKGGNACIAADCVMNPKIVTDMKADPSHFHFVCDLIIQCAERKFQHTRFGGRALERSFKLPKMKYAGYVDERTNLSIMPKAVEVEGGLPDSISRPVVSKQRVKGGGGKVPIIEEIEFTKNDPPGQLSKVRIELFVTTDEKKQTVPLLDFLREAACSGASLHPQLKPCKDTEDLSESQLLKIPLPFKNCQATAIIAKCTFPSGLSKSDLPEINVSAFLLTLSKTEINSTTECVLPFAVDTHKISALYETKSGMFELRMPILQSAVDFEAKADPGTRQWEIQNAFRTTKRSGGKKGEKAGISSNMKKECVDADYDLVHTVSKAEDEDDFGTLPEDVFHSQDVMSRHLLQKQEEMQKSQHQKNVGRKGADVEHIHVDYFKPGGKYHTKKETSRESRDPLLQKAEEVFKQHIPRQSGGNLAFGLV